MNPPKKKMADWFKSVFAGAESWQPLFDQAEINDRFEQRLNQLQPGWNGPRYQNISMIPAPIGIETSGTRIPSGYSRGRTNDALKSELSYFVWSG